MTRKPRRFDGQLQCEPIMDLTRDIFHSNPGESLKSSTQKKAVHSDSVHFLHSSVKGQTLWVCFLSDLSPLADREDAWLQTQTVARGNGKNIMMNLCIIHMLPVMSLIKHTGEFLHATDYPFAVCLHLISPTSTLAD